MNISLKKCVLIFFLNFLFLFISHKTLSFAQEEPRWERVGLEGWNTEGSGSIANNSQTIYLVAHRANTDPNYQYPEIYDIFKTTDGGITWVSKKKGLPTNNLGISAVTVDPKNPEIVYIAAGEGWGPFRDGGIYKSSNGGNSWMKVRSGVGFINIVVDYDDSNIIYGLNVGVNNAFGFYKSIDGGISWTRKALDTYAEYYRRIVLDLANHSVIYVLASPYNGNAGVFKSTDKGTSFTSIPDNVGLMGSPTDLTTDLYDSNTVYIAVSTSTDIAGVYKSTNGGNAWFKTSNGLDNADVKSVEIDLTNNSILYLSAYKSRLNQGTIIKSPYYSIDSGQTWYPFNNGLSILNENLSIGLLYVSNDLGFLFGASNDGLWKYPLVSSIPNFTPTPTNTPTPTPTPTNTPTPTPNLCVLNNFGDADGNPIRQDKGLWADKAYGGIYYDLKKKKFANFDPLNPNPNLVFLPFIDYGNGQDTIANWGCALTSYTMILNYAARYQGKPGNILPDEVNKWFQENQGYTTGTIYFKDGKPSYVNEAGVKAEKVPEFAKVKKIYVQTKNPEFIIKEVNLNNQLCNKNPIKAAVNKGGHYIALSGQAITNNQSTYRIHDPLEYLPMTLLHKYGGIDKIASYELIDTHPAGLYMPVIGWRIYSPAELVITDPNGNKLGFDPRTNISYKEIDDGIYYEDTLGSALGDHIMKWKTIRIENPISGQYQVEVIATGNGDYALDFYSSDNNSEVKNSHLQSTIKTGLTDNYVVNYSEQNENPEMIRQVSIDIRPNSEFNKVVPQSQGLIPVAILGTYNFQAESIDEETLEFGPEKAKPFKKINLVKDVNGDKIADLVIFFKNPETGIGILDKEACLTGQTKDGVSFEGCDKVSIKSWPKYLEDWWNGLFNRGKRD